MSLRALTLKFHDEVWRL